MYEQILKYIDEYWNNIICNPCEESGVQLKLNHSFVCPNNEIFNNQLFYWDSYFIIIGLIEADKVDLAKDIVNNLCELFERFKIIPMRNRTFNTGISQQPYLTSMIKLVYEKTQDKEWLRYTANIAKEELETYWKSTDERQHLTETTLSRYADHHIIHATSEQESGWDMTSRFNGECLNFNPIDLNCLLYKYEKDLEEFYTILNDDQSNYYKEQSEKRKEIINKLCYNKEKGFFFDYNYKEQKQQDFFSLAGFYPLFAKLATQQQAEQLVYNLDKFLQPGGLATTQKTSTKEFHQWDFPNGWAPLQFIVIQGLLNYNFTDEAKEIAKRWLDTNEKVFNETNTLWEKYDVVKCTQGKNGRYKTQSGFAWTNAIFLKLIKIFEI